ncbi:HDOD domain-containing protein [Geothrix edaphica]|uniref:HD family phosphohydrolase n=1 Tax=Geothrix edaphica TaxID=2927976 RepID=A0ABQ5Q006_9BACT|nr:HDOD domain-containing protein [Geothrix edaphica]GLH67966.1 HD family phosphohydrolase [Geothrix edaphica]
MSITPQELTTNLGDLPPLPQVAAQVLRLALDPETTAGDFQRVISLDPALAGQVLRISNSTSFGMMREVTTLTQAVTTLGVSALKSVVIASSARNLYHRGSVGPEEQLLWEHARVAAMASRAFAARLGLPQTEEAFVGGLLHDIGKSVLAMKFPERYGLLLRAVHGQKGACLDLEREAFGFDHAMVGEALAGQWNLAHSLQAAVRWHHDPLRAAEDHRPLTAVVALGNHLALDQRAGLGDPARLEEASRQAREILGLEPGALARLRAEVRAAVEREQAALTEF